MNKDRFTMLINYDNVVNQKTNYTLALLIDLTGILIMLEHNENHWISSFQRRITELMAPPVAPSLYYFSIRHFDYRIC